MAWTIAGVGRRTRDAAEEAARRAGMRLDDWLDEAIADQAALAQRNRPEDNEAEDERLDAAAGRLERIARRNEGAREPRSAGDSGLFRFGDRALRGEALTRRSAGRARVRIGRRDPRAFECGAGRRSAGADRCGPAAGSDQWRLEPARLKPREGAAPKPRLDLKAAVSQIAMRRHGARRQPASGGSRLAMTRPRAMQSPPAADEFDAQAEVAESRPGVATGGIVA